MQKKRREHSAEFKFRVALEAAKESQTISELASKYEVHPTLVRSWKRQLMGEGAGVFRQPSKRQENEQEAAEAELYEQIGRLKMKLEC